MFGAAYTWVGWTARVTGPVLALGATGQAVFGLSVLGLCVAGKVPFPTAQIAGPDLVPAVGFLGRLLRR